MVKTMEKLFHIPPSEIKTPLLLELDHRAEYIQNRIKMLFELQKFDNLGQYDNHNEAYAEINTEIEKMNAEFNLISTMYQMILRKHTVRFDE